MKRSLSAALFLMAVLLVIGFFACEKQTPNLPKPTGNIIHGDFVTEAEMLDARKAALERNEPCAKWCGGPISAATNNPNKIGCSDSRCKELYLSDPPKKLFRRCEGADCNSCNRFANTYYSVDCDETMDGCLVMFSTMSKCE
jgi:hypothetical protein